MIIRLILPKRLSGPTQDLVSSPRRRSFQPSHQHRCCDHWENQQVHVVRHHHPSTKIIEMPLASSHQNRVGDRIGNPRVLEPSRSRSARGQNAILSRESVAWRSVQSSLWLGGKCPPKTPSEEQISTVRMVMRQSSSVFGHRYGRAGETACPTNTGVFPPQRFSPKCTNSRGCSAAGRAQKTMVCPRFGVSLIQRICNPGH